MYLQQVFSLPWSSLLPAFLFSLTDDAHFFNFWLFFIPRYSPFAVLISSLFHDACFFQPATILQCVMLASCLSISFQSIPFFHLEYAFLIVVIVHPCPPPFHQPRQNEDWPLRGKRHGYGACRKQEGITLTWHDLTVYVPEKKSCFSRNTDVKRPTTKVLCNGEGSVEID